uniref:Kinesin-like protein n=1 Tax=Blastobotrys adeninivorans TaxID=409370 RepID=A0A060TG87_BLAAD
MRRSGASTPSSPVPVPVSGQVPQSPGGPLSPLSPKTTSGSIDGLTSPVPSPSPRNRAVAVNVAVRIRPPLEQTASRSIQTCTSNSITIATHDNTKRFVYDRVFGENTGQSDVWNYLSESTSRVVQGYNVSIMAYGQSGSGKSYTMGTADDHKIVADESVMGITSRAARALFQELESGNRTNSISSDSQSIRPPSIHFSAKNRLGAQDLLLDSKPWTVSVSYLEIYNEQLRDLLAASSGSTSNSKQIMIREDAKGNIKVVGLKEVVIDNVYDLLMALEEGSRARQVNSTMMNAHSSRSHAVFSIHLTQKQLDPDTGIITTITSKLNLVDLAGSERLKNTGSVNEGRIKEGISINSGLTALGKVISQLSTRPGSYISYRDSKLTRMLQDSLGGKALTYLIACVSPEAFYVSETLSTLSYAQRARAIQLNPEVQKTGHASTEDLLRTISQLQQEVQHWKARASASSSSSQSAQAMSPLSGSQFGLPLSPSTPTRGEQSLDASLDSSVEASKTRIMRSTEFQSAVESIISDYEQTIESLQESVASCRATNQDLTDMLEEKEESLFYAEMANEELSDLIETLQAQIHRLETRQHVHSNTADLETQVVQLQAQLSTFRAEHKRQNTETQYLISRYNATRKEMEALTREKEQLEAELRRSEITNRVNNSKPPSLDTKLRQFSLSSTSSVTSESDNETAAPLSQPRRRTKAFFVKASVT